MGVGNRIAQQCVNKGLSVRQLALKADIPYSTLYSAIKRDSNGIDTATIKKIASALGVSWYELLSDDPHEQAQGIIDDVFSRMQKSIATNDPMQKASDPINSGIFEIQFKSDDDQIAYLYSLLNDPGKFEASRCFFRHLDKESIPEVIAYLKQLANTPQYQKKPEE